MATTSGAQHAMRQDTSNQPLLVRLTRQLEGARELDGWDGPARAAAQALTSQPAVRDLLKGRAVGHAVHPVLTDLPIGCWTSAAVLDLIGGRQGQRAAQQLVGVGLITAAPTVVTGLAEWAETSGAERRVGFVHAGANAVALVLYAHSFQARRRGRHRAGAVSGMAGIAVASVGGFLGSHLALARKVGSRHEAFAEGPAGSD